MHIDTKPAAPIAGFAGLIAFAGLAGTCATTAAAADLDAPAFQLRDAEPDAYIYHILSTGERIVSRDIAIQSNRTSGGWEWSTGVVDPCTPADYEPEDGLVTAVVPTVHDAGRGDDREPRAITYRHDWFEHPGDSVFNIISVATFVQIVDVDSQGDGVGDGIEGLDCIIVFTENDAPDSRSNAVAHTPIIIRNLSGSLDDGASDGAAGDGEISFQEGQILFNIFDFGPGINESDIEIGDTNGKSDGKFGEDSRFSGIPGVDTDGDGLINGGFIIGFRQPGVAEGDGLIARFPELAGAEGLANPDGPDPDPATFPNIRPVGFPLTAPSDNAESYDNRAPGDLDWPYNPDYAYDFGEGVGSVDGHAVIDADGNDIGRTPAQFSCDPDADRPPFWEQPWWTADIRFYSADLTGPGCNDADLARPYFLLDLDDIVAFIAAYQTGSSDADLVEPFGVLDLADITEFIGDFLAGCP